MARLVAPAAPPLARFAPKNFQNWSGVIAFGPVPMKTALNLSLKEKLTFVQLTCLALVGRLPASLVGKREALIEKKGAKASGAACGKAEREKEGRSNGGAHVDLSREKSRWQLWLAFLGVVAVLASATVALPPSHPVLLHTLFWPSLALSLSYPVTRISNPEERDLSPKAKATNRILLPLFFANFAGVVCARSLHVQFCSWCFCPRHSHRPALQLRGGGGDLPLLCPRGVPLQPGEELHLHLPYPSAPTSVQQHTHR